MFKLKYQSFSLWSKSAPINKLFMSTKSKIKPAAPNQFINPNGERIKISSIDLPLRERNWTPGEIQLLDKMLKLNFFVADALVQFPTRSHEHIDYRAGSWIQYTHLVDVVKNSVFEKNLKAKENRVSVKLKNGSEFFINSFDLPTKTIVMNEEITKMILTYYKNDRLRFHMGWVFPICDRYQFNYFIKYYYKKYNLKNLSPQKLTYTSAFDLPLSTTTLSIREKEYLQKVFQLGIGFDHLINAMPNRSIDFISKQYDRILNMRISGDEMDTTNKKFNNKLHENCSKVSKAPNNLIVNISEFDLPIRMGRFSNMEMELFQVISKNYSTTKGFIQNMPIRNFKQINNKIERTETIKTVGPWLSSERKRLVEAMIPYLEHKPQDSDSLIFDDIPWRIIGQAVQTRTPFQCRYQWNNVLNPSIQKNKSFTKEEDAILLKLGSQISHDLFKNLLPGRTLQQTKTRFLELRKSSEKVWTKKELFDLYEATYLYGLRDWKRVSAHVKTRNIWQCSSKWVANRYPNGKNPKATPEIQALNFKLADRLLTILHRQHKLISALIPGFSYNRLVHFGRNLLIDKHKIRYKRVWSSEETSILIDLFLEHGMDWEIIGKKLEELIGEQVSPYDLKFKIKTILQTKYARADTSILKIALVDKYQEEKAKGLLFPKLRNYILEEYSV